MVAACGGATATVTGDPSDDGSDASAPLDGASTLDATSPDASGEDATAADASQGDTATTSPDATPAPDASPPPACAGVECSGFNSSAYTAVCANDNGCVGEVHQADCCGARQVIGMSAGVDQEFCIDEVGINGAGGCRASYPTPPPCTSDVITTDEGTTTILDFVAVRCVGPSNGGGVGTCKTNVCGGQGQPSCPQNRGVEACP